MRISDPKPRAGKPLPAAFVCSLTVLLGLLASCGQRPGPAAVPKISTAPAANSSTTADRPPFDIPRLDGITVDGDPTDWGTRGFAVTVMHAQSGRRLPTTQFDAQLQLGWNDRGLLLLADVTDSDVRESSDDLILGDGASIDVTETDAKNKEAWHVVVSPGVDPRHPAMRINFTDDRTKAMRVAAITIDSAVKKKPHGYVIEELLPWDILRIDPKIGSEFSFSITVNHPDGDQGNQLWWSPEMSLIDGKGIRRLRLADAPHGPVSVAADGGYERFHRTRIVVAATADAAGKLASIKTSDGPIAQAVLSTDGRIATTQICLPIPPIGKPYHRMDLTLDGIPVGSVSISNADDSRRGAAENMDVIANPSVFTQTDLPRVDFLNPAAAEDLIGNYIVRTTYYDTDYNLVTSADRLGRYGAIAVVTPEHGKPFKRYITLYRAPKDFNTRPLPLKAALQLPSKLGIDRAVGLEQASSAGDLLAEEMRNSRHRDDDFALYLAGLSETAPSTPDLPRRLGIEGKNTAWWYGLRRKIGDLLPYKYLVHVPDYKQSALGAKYPMILFLHGSGQRGDNLADVKHNGPPDLLQNEPNWPPKYQFIIVSPQCRSNETWNPLMLRDLLDEVTAKYPVDTDRIYLTGLSMGGFGTWDLAEWFPERFAALVPVCGGGDPADVSRLQDIPTWVFHGGRDPTVRIECAYEMVQAMRDIHARIRFTVFPDRGHNSWVPTYDDPRLYQWLLKQRRGQPDQPKSTTADTRPADQ